MHGIMLPALLALVPLAQAQSTPSTRPAGVTADDLAPHVVPVRSIDPADDDFADLMPLKEAIGDSRVVVLGEQSHGDGPVFLAKARLIRFLHQECGFDVLVWESGLYDCTRVHEALKAGGGREAFDLGVFPIWTRSAQVHPTLDYVIESYQGDRPLEIAGYDAQITSGQSDIGEAIVAFARVLGDDHPAAALAASVAKGCEVFTSVPPAEEAERRKGLADIVPQAQELAEVLTAERARLVEAHGEARTALMLQSVRSVGCFFEMVVEMDRQGEVPDAASGNARDRQMGENLAFLAREMYPDRKLIVWCATFHAIHAPPEVHPLMRPDHYERTVTGGQVAREKLGETMYTIGFEADHGRVANVFRQQAWPLMPSPEGSVGAAFAAGDEAFAFLDLRGLPEDHPMRKPQVGRELGYMPVKAVWPDQVDAIFFIREMIPRTADHLAPPGYELSR